MNADLETPTSAGIVLFTPERVPQCTPVKSSGVQSGLYFGHKTPLSRLQQFVHQPSPRWRTPDYCSNHTPASGAASYYNPFELGQVDTLHQPIFSPNVFKTSTPGSIATQPVFQWSIDDIALLKPTDIELPPHHEAWLSRTNNRELEERAQRAIDTYFSSHCIAPSPWTDSTKPFKLPMTPGSEADSPMIFSTKSALSRILPLSKPCSDAVTQTVLSFPVNFDLEALIGARHNYAEVNAVQSDLAPTTVGGSSDDELTNQEALSNSSLRRKLFFHGDEGTPISPVRCHRLRTTEGMEYDELASPMMSPIQTRSIAASDQTDTQLVGHFSSSPIRLLCPAIRRCSTHSQPMESPAMSPIGLHDTPCYNTPGPSNATTVTPKEIVQSVSCNAIQRLSSPETSPVLTNFTITPLSTSAVYRRVSSHAGNQTVGQPVRPIKRLDLEAFSEEDSFDSVDRQHSLTDYSHSGQLQLAGNHDDYDLHLGNGEPASSQTASIDTGYQSNILQTTSQDVCPLEVPDLLTSIEDMSLDGSSVGYFEPATARKKKSLRLGADDQVMRSLGYDDNIDSDQVWKTWDGINRPDSLPTRINFD